VDGAVVIHVQPPTGIQGADDAIGHFIFESGQGVIIVAGGVKHAFAIGIPQFGQLGVGVGYEAGHELAIGLLVIVPAIRAGEAVQFVA
jgi:hypothetical protein